MRNDFVIAALYKFTPLKNYREIRENLFDVCSENGVFGTILLAEEGINGTIAANREGIDATLSFLRKIPGLADIEHKESLHTEMPFQRLKIKLKQEIVTMGIPGINPPEEAGTYVSPEEWNALISDPDVLVIDTRNDYEFQVGTFKRAINPKTGHFTEFPAFVEQQLDPSRHKKVAMFCTGGIRCEKATAFMQRKGFENVYHLRGGILKYLEEMPESASLWDGECFVFDERVTVDHKLQRGQYALCKGCGNPVRLSATAETVSETICEDCARKEK